MARPRIVQPCYSMCEAVQTVPTHVLCSPLIVGTRTLLCVVCHSGTGSSACCRVGASGCYNCIAQPLCLTSGCSLLFADCWCADSSPPALTAPHEFPDSPDSWLLTFQVCVMRLCCYVPAPFQLVRWAWAVGLVIITELSSTSGCWVGVPCGSRCACTGWDGQCLPRQISCRVAMCPPGAGRVVFGKLHKRAVPHCLLVRCLDSPFGNTAMEGFVAVLMRVLYL